MVPFAIVLGQWSMFHNGKLGGGDPSVDYI